MEDLMVGSQFSWPAVLAFVSGLVVTSVTWTAASVVFVMKIQTSVEIVKVACDGLTQSLKQLSNVCEQMRVQIAHLDQTVNEHERRLQNFEDD